MPGLDPYSIALSLAPGIFKGITGLFQRGETVTHTDTTPAAFKESLALQRQRAATPTMPGEGQAMTAIAQAQAAGVRNAALGSASSADFLAAAGAADGRRAQAEQQLGVQRERYRDSATQQLQQGLAKQAQFQQDDNNRYNQATAALQGNGLSNIFGGLSDAASAGVYAIAQGGKGNPSPAGAGGSIPVPPPPVYYDPSDPGGYGRRRQSSYIKY